MPNYRTVFKPILYLAIIYKMLKDFYFIGDLVIITSNQWHGFVVTKIRTYYRKTNKLRSILQ